MEDPKDALLRKAREYIADLSRPLPYVPTRIQLELIDEIDEAIAAPEALVTSKPLSTSQH
jgi:hypothetical protein